MAVRQFRPAEYSGLDAARQAALNQIEKAGWERPVEKMVNGQQVQNETADERRHKTRMEQGKAIFEKYDRKGNLVLRLPPENVNERV